MIIFFLHLGRQRVWLHWN